jgi:hypothetical protein
MDGIIAMHLGIAHNLVRDALVRSAHDFVENLGRIAKFENNQGPQNCEPLHKDSLTYWENCAVCTLALDPARLE